MKFYTQYLATGMEEVHEAIDRKINRAFQEGLAAGIRKFAWWKEGGQFVGTTGKTLKEALKDIKESHGDNPGST